MLKGDKFTVEQWLAAVKQPANTSDNLPLEIEAALSDLHAKCREAGIPVLSILCSGKSTHSSWDMGDRPEEVTGQFLMARVTVAEDSQHAMAVAPAVMKALHM